LAAGVAELAGALRNDPISKATGMAEVVAVLGPVGMEMKVDRQVQDLVKMATATQRLMK
jgi:limonene-1,2-epoxide hydrolase